LTHTVRAVAAVTWLSVASHSFDLPPDGAGSPGGWALLRCRVLIPETGTAGHSADGLAANLGMDLRTWTQRYQDEVVLSQVRYRGVLTWKNVLDLWVYLEIFWDTGVEAVVEIGVKHGGTTLWLADQLKTLVGERGVVIGVDLKLPETEMPANVRLLEGDSLDPALIGQVRGLLGDRRTMVIADGNHAADHVLGEMRAYGPMVSDGCYFIAEDGIVDVMDWEAFTPGPQVAARRFVEESADFRIDREREKFLLTYAPDGFLLKGSGQHCSAGERPHEAR
jgi:cephalosporin hydroxylase